MDKVALVVQRSRAGRTHAGLVWTGICLRLGRVYFPAREWTDFSVVVLAWWAQALAKLVGGTAERQEIRFMEGPFSVEIRTTGPDRWRVTCIEKALRSVVRVEADVDPTGLVGSVLRSGEELLELCRAEDWWSSDTVALEADIETLKSSLARTPGAGDRHGR